MASSSDMVSLDLELPIDICFSPAYLSDFVIHFEGHNFHVHRVKLRETGSYFQALIDGMKKRKLEKDDEEACSFCLSSSDPQKQCVRFIKEELPKCATAPTFLLFLLHFYQPDRFYFPPYLPSSLLIDPDNTLETLSLLNDYEKENDKFFKTKSDLITAFIPYPYETNQCNIYLNTSLLQFAHYFDCARLLSLCDQNLLQEIPVIAKFRMLDSDQVKKIWYHLQIYHLKISAEFHLDKSKAACLDRLGQIDAYSYRKNGREELKQDEIWLRLSYEIKYEHSLATIRHLLKMI